MTDTFDKDRLEQWRKNALRNESAERLKSLSTSAGSVTPARLQFRDWVADKDTGYSMLVERWSDGQIHILDEHTPSQNAEGQVRR